MCEWLYECVCVCGDWWSAANCNTNFLRFLCAIHFERYTVRTECVVLFANSFFGVDSIRIPRERSFIMCCVVFGAGCWMQKSKIENILETWPWLSAPPLPQGRFGGFFETQLLQLWPWSLWPISFTTLHGHRRGENEFIKSQEECGCFPIEYCVYDCNEERRFVHSRIEKNPKSKMWEKKKWCVIVH